MLVGQQRKQLEAAELFSKLDLSLEDQKRSFTESLRVFVKKLHNFDLSKLY